MLKKNDLAGRAAGHGEQRGDLDEACRLPGGEGPPAHRGDEFRVPRKFEIALEMGRFKGGQPDFFRSAVDRGRFNIHASILPEKPRGHSGAASR